MNKAPKKYRGAKWLKTRLSMRYKMRVVFRTIQMQGYLQSANEEIKAIKSQQAPANASDSDKARFYTAKVEAMRNVFINLKHSWIKYAPTI